MMYKTCTKCGESKPITEFHLRSKAKGTRRNECKECHYEYNRAHYLKHIEEYKARAAAAMAQRRTVVHKFLYEHLREHPCVDCGESNPLVLAFDHVNGSKKHNISRMRAGNSSVEAIAQEMEKCVVRCTNCHTLRHRIEDKCWMTKLMEEDRRVDRGR